MSHDKPIRVLHVVHQLNRGGVETWLLEVLRRLDRRTVAVDVLVHTDEPGELDGEVRACGAQVLPCLKPSRPWRYAHRFRQLVRDHGPYDIVHCHLHSWCGVVMRLASAAGIPHRIAHSQNDIRAVIARQSMPMRAYHALMRRWVRRYTTLGFAVSSYAACSLFGDEWDNLPFPIEPLPDAIDSNLFASAPPAGDVRKELGFDAGALVIGHVGRFVAQKNHDFLVRLFAAVAAREPRARLLLIGEGPRQDAVRRQVVELGLSNRVLFAGSRDDVPRLLCGAANVFALPSIHEGLPRVAMEAQAAGLPMILSEVITEESTIIPELMHRLPLEAGVDAWADKMIAMLHQPPPLSREAAINRLRATEFDIERNVGRLQQVYERCVAEASASTRSKN